jgi:hypothetical protein
MSSHKHQKQHKQSSPLSRIGVAVVGFLLAVSFFIWISQVSNSKETKNEQQSASQASGSISASERSFDFGTISMARGPVTKTIVLRASETEPAAITRIQTSCMCTSALLKKGGRTFGPFGMPGHGIVPSIREELAAGEEAVLEVTFDPAAHGPSGVGRIDRIITVEQGGEQKPIEIEFSALVTP